MRRLKHLREDDEALLKMDSHFIKIVVGILLMSTIFAFGISVSGMHEDYQGEVNEDFQDDDYYEEPDEGNESQDGVVNVTYDPVTFFEGTELVVPKIFEPDYTYWDVGVDYDTDEYVMADGKLYYCIQDHTSSNSKRPGNGSDWENYWELDQIVWDLEFDFPWWDFDTNFQQALDWPVISTIYDMYDVMVDSPPKYVGWFFGSIFLLMIIAVIATFVRMFRISWT